MHAPTAEPALPALPVLSVLFSPTPRGARRARLLALHQLGEWGIPRDSSTAEAVAVVTAELAANAAVHGRLRGRYFRLRLHLQEHVVRIEVSDARPERPVPTAAMAGTTQTHADSDHGRGLVLVAAFAERWGCFQPHVAVKTVWAEVRR
ncbi:ATP-binding protein [Streptomyces sp. WMMC500]|uniref:ATP-binding protein n=1 Tax=Streptomyces sp. WMMC500 TaxID=3015154 RepID=UPI00248CC24A|nr:ATP-binding protein [Streptomyces sp. WMMC500]WBB59082.1 ATP-binding protein [Streptomyces sp. WMMC500]